VAGEARGAPADVAVMVFGVRRPGGLRPILVRVEAGLDDLDEDQVRGDQGDQDQEELERERRKAERVRDRGEGRIAPTTAQAIGSAIIARLGRLRRNGTRRVRMTKTTRVWVASDSTTQPVRTRGARRPGRRASP
jgi:hypothetical protein